MQGTTRHEGTQDVFCVVGVPRGFEAKGVSTTRSMPPADTPRPSVSIVGLMPFLAAAMPDTAARGSFVMFQYRSGRYSCSVACRLADTSGVWHYVKDYTIGAISLTTATVLPLRPAALTPECRPVYRDDSLGIGIRMPCTVTRNGKAPDASVVVRAVAVVPSLRGAPAAEAAWRESHDGGVRARTFTAGMDVRGRTQVSLRDCHRRGGICRSHGVVNHCQA